MKLNIAFLSGRKEVYSNAVYRYKGVLFFVHVFDMLHTINGRYRASELRTGYGIPETTVDTEEAAVELAKIVIGKISPDGFDRAMEGLPVINAISPEDIREIP